MGDLVEAWRSSKKKLNSGSVSLICLDDNELEDGEYGKMGDRTIVPRARELGGGLEGLPLGNDCKYGYGVTRRKIVDDGNGGFKVEEEIENFRPDQAQEDPDLFSDEALAAAGVELGDDLQKQAMDIMTDVPNIPAPSGNGHHAAASNQPDQMIQMMQMMMGMMQKPPVEYQEERKPKKSADPGINVMFSGDFGKMKVRYSSAIIEPEFVVLVSTKDHPTMYEPPISSDKILTITVSGQSYQVLSLGLSFSHKGDILLLMPIVLERTEGHAEEEQQ